MVMRRLFILFALFAACEAKKDVIEVASPLPTPDPLPPPSAAPAASSRPPAIVLSECVLHAGGGNRHSSKVKVGDGSVTETKSGSCYYGAECVRMPGNAQPGDGFVGVKCEGTHCTCTITSATDDRKTEESFDIEDLCTSGDIAKSLLIERCMKDMPPPK